MPRGDRSGPMGAGPMTGRALGYCAGQAAPGYATAGPGYGRGTGGYGGGGYGGGGRGFRHRFYATGMPGWERAGYAPAYGPPAGYAPPVAPSPRNEAAALKAESEYLAGVLEDVRSRLAELESEKDQ